MSPAFKKNNLSVCICVESEGRPEGHVNHPNVHIQDDTISQQIQEYSFLTNRAQTQLMASIMEFLLVPDAFHVIFCCTATIFGSMNTFWSIHSSAQQRERERTNVGLDKQLDEGEARATVDEVARAAKDCSKAKMADARDGSWRDGTRRGASATCSNQSQLFGTKQHAKQSTFLGQPRTFADSEWERWRAHYGGPRVLPTKRLPIVAQSHLVRSVAVPAPAQQETATSRERRAHRVKNERKQQTNKTNKHTQKTNQLTSKHTHMHEPTNKKTHN